MNKQEYISNPIVLSFAEFLNDVVEGKTNIDLKNKYCKYEWKKSSYADNSRKLNWFKNNFKCALEKNDKYKLYAFCMRTMMWGESCRNSDAEWLDRLVIGGKLIERFNELKDVFEVDEPCIDDFGDKTDAYFRINSSYSKIYSLLYNKFVIYDGRVGAALGLLSRKYHEQKKLSVLKTELIFAWDQTGKIIDNIVRNPSNEIYVFPDFKGYRKDRDHNYYAAKLAWNDNLNGCENEASFHAWMNIRANWLFEKVLEKRDKLWGDTDPYRALEAALFMLGENVIGENSETGN